MNTAVQTLGLGLPTGWEYMILLILGLLFFGRRLPEVGRSLGQGIMEFKRGLKGVADEVEAESTRPARTSAALPNSDQGVRIESPRNPAGQEVRVSRADTVD